MPTNKKRTLFVSFGVKMLQTLSIESEASGYKIARAVYIIFNSLSEKDTTDTIPMGRILRNAATPMITSTGDSHVLQQVRSIFSKSTFHVDETKPIGEQGESFQMMREDISRYTSFTKDIILPLFSSSGSTYSTTFVSVLPMFICILLSSLSSKRTGTMDLMTQIDKIVYVANLGSTENIRTKLGRLTTAQRQFQSSLPPDVINRPPDLIGEMIASVKNDIEMSEISRMGTSGLDIKIGAIKALMELVK